MTDSSKIEQVLQAVFGALQSIPDRADYGLTGMDVQRNAAQPQTVPPQGLIIVRDGTPQVSEPRTLGGFAPVLLDHAIPIELFIQAGDDTARDLKWDLALSAIAAVLPENSTLQGLVFGLTIDPPAPAEEAIQGAAAVKAATITVTLQYEAPTALG